VVNLESEGIFLHARYDQLIFCALAKLAAHGYPSVRDFVVDSLALVVDNKGADYGASIRIPPPALEILPGSEIFMKAKCRSGCPLVISTAATLIGSWCLFSTVG
jgi:hypothetical protein